MTWVYRHTRSLLVGILMHASLTSSMLVLGPAVTGTDLLIYDIAFATLLWVAAAFALATEGRARALRQSTNPYVMGGHQPSQPWPH